MAIKTILVEDNETIREQLLATMEELAALEIIGIAETQLQARQVLEQHAGTWKLVVIDLSLRDGTGLGVLRECRNRQPGQVALVLTSYLTAAMRASCLELGADGVFDKSLELEAFFERCLALEPSRS